MATLTLRLVKGSELEWNEVDNNFSNLNTEIINNTSRIAQLESINTITITSEDLLVSDGDNIGIDVSGGSVLITLPAIPVEGDKVFLFCAGGDFATNAVVVSRNGNTIMGLAENMTISDNNISTYLIYTGSTWRIA